MTPCLSTPRPPPTHCNCGAPVWPTAVTMCARHAIGELQRRAREPREGVRNRLRWATLAAEWGRLAWEATA